MHNLLYLDEICVFWTRMIIEVVENLSRHHENEPSIHICGILI